MTQHQDDNIIIHPRRGRGEKSLPENGLLFVNPAEAASALTTLRKKGGKKRKLFHSGLVVAPEEEFFAAGPAIGAPMAVLTLEKLVVLGVKRLVLCGWCGAVASELRIGDIIVPELAEAGEGTSPYYPAPRPLRPHHGLRRELLDLLQERGLAAAGGTLWSTDAPYREERTTLARLHHQHGVVAVDMEFSALCAVAAFRGIALAAVLVVSDELTGAAWRPGFSIPLFLRQTSAVLTALLDQAGNLQEG